MGDSLHVDPDNLDRLGRDMINMAGFLDGGTPLGVGDATSDDIADRVDTLIEAALGGARETPLRSISDQSSNTAAPAALVRYFADNWEGIRADIASDIRTVGALLQQSGQSYQDRDEDISWELSSVTPAAPAVPRDPLLIGGGTEAGISLDEDAEHLITQDGPR